MEVSLDSTDMKAKYVYPSAKEIPPMAVSSWDMRYNKTGSWRTVKPRIDYDKCIYCLSCWQYCPEPAIGLEPVEVKGKKREKPVVDYDFCKGCGICWTECPVQAIEVVAEEK